MMIDVPDNKRLTENLFAIAIFLNNKNNNDEEIHGRMERLFEPRLARWGCMS